MASTSAAISIFVLLLATYCYSIPIGNEFEHSTVDTKVIGEHDVLPFTSFEETTIEPQIHIKRSSNVGHESDESGEHTTERSWSHEHKTEKRTMFDETTLPLSERSVDGVEFEATTVVPQSHIKRTLFIHHGDDNESSEHTTERSWSHEGKKEKRTMVDETVTPLNERSVDDVEFEATTVVPQSHIKRTLFIHHGDDSESSEYTTERSWSTGDKKEKRTMFDETTLSFHEREVESGSDANNDQEKHENEQVTFDMSTSGVHSEESKATRNFDLDLVNTVESSTEFNSRVGRFMNNESDVAAITEPTSSMESFGQSTGLLKTRTFPETAAHKFEGAREEVYTTFKPDY